MTQEWTSDSGKGHIHDTHLSCTCVVTGKKKLWNLIPGVYTDELSGLKIKSRGNSQLGGGQSKGKLWGRKLFSVTTVFRDEA